MTDVEAGTRRMGRPLKSARPATPVAPGDYIRVARERARLSQRALAERVRWHWHTIMRLETGQTSVTEERLRVIAHALGVHPGEIAAPGSPLHEDWVRQRGMRVALPGAGYERGEGEQAGMAPGGVDAAGIPPGAMLLHQADYRPIPVRDWIELALRPDWAQLSAAQEYVMWDVHGYETDQIAAARVPAEAATQQLPTGTIAILNRSVPTRLGLDRMPPSLVHLPLAMVSLRGQVRILRVVARRGDLAIEDPDTGALLESWHPDARFRAIGSILGAISIFS